MQPGLNNGRHLELQHKQEHAKGCGGEEWAPVAGEIDLDGGKLFGSGQECGMMKSSITTGVNDEGREYQSGGKRRNRCWNGGGKGNPRFELFDCVRECTC